ncbi:MAG TPA: PKD domain-containing protein, partial [Thermoplasmata archaeon]|nr:PKD domain-containing protein [Thermoplasmata archaeon]
AADLGLPIAFSGAASNGTPPYHFAWSFGDGSTGAGKSLNHTFNSTGEYVVRLTVTDHAGGSVVTERVVQVVPLPKASIIAEPGDTTDVGLNVTLIGNESGGAGPGSAVWEMGNGARLTTPNVTYAWPQDGLYEVSYSYTDAFGVEALAALDVLVNPTLSGQFDLVAARSVAEVGTQLNFTATLAGGTSPFTVTWAFGDGSTAVGSSVSHEFARAGSYTVTVSAVDAVGERVSTTFANVVIAARPSGAAPLLGGGFGPSFVLGLLVGAVGAAVALFVAERARRAGPPGPPSPYVPPEPADLRGRT